MNKISESIFSGSTTIIPMADVQHIERHRYNTETIEAYKNGNKKIFDGIKVIMKSTRYSTEIDDWENNIYLSKEEADEFLKSWCFYRHEFDYENPELLTTPLSHK